MILPYNPQRYRTPFWAVIIGLLQFIIIFLGIIIIYCMVIHQQELSGSGQDAAGRDIKISENNNNYYPGVIGLLRLSRTVESSGRDLHLGAHK